MFCSQCGKELLENSKFCTDCGKKLSASSEIVAEKETENQMEHSQNASTNDNSEYDERSGKGKDSIIPKEIIEWNWGAAGLGIIWGIYHKVWVSLLTLVVPFGWIAMGKAGNGWAWRNNKWKSVEEFQKVQAKWQLWGKVFFIIIVVINFLPYLVLNAPKNNTIFCESNQCGLNNTCVSKPLNSYCDEASYTGWTCNPGESYFIKPYMDIVFGNTPICVSREQLNHACKVKKGADSFLTGLITTDGKYNCY